MRRFLLGFVIGILVLPAGVIFCAWMGLLPTTVHSKPLPMEAHIAQMALNASAARNAPHLTNPIPATEENLRVGMKLFRGDCSGCHGEPTADMDYGVTLYPNVPQFWKNPPRLPDFQLFWIAKNGVRYSGMFAFGGQWGKDASGNDTSDQKIWSAVLFLSHLDSLPPAVNAEWHAKPAHQ